MLDRRRRRLLGERSPLGGRGELRVHVGKRVGQVESARSDRGGAQAAHQRLAGERADTWRPPSRPTRARSPRRWRSFAAGRSAAGWSTARPPADEALQSIAHLHIAHGRLTRFTPIAARLGSDHWRPIVAMAEAALARGRDDFAREVFAAADQPGMQQDYLRKRCRELTGAAPASGAMPVPGSRPRQVAGVVRSG